MSIKYEIRYFNPKQDRDYYCALWVSYGQNIFVGYPHIIRTRAVYEEIKRFEQGCSEFKTVEDLHKWAFHLLGYKEV